MAKRANERVAWFNGEFMPESEVKVPFRDSSWLYGDGAFDMTRSFNGKAFRLQQHIDRFYRSLKYIGVDPGMSPKEMIGGVLNGFYITELIGMGVNGVTGDYSRGAGGYWIEHGELAFPVSEVTIAGNLTDMFLNLTPASDLEFRHGTDAPTIRIDGMTVAGV